MRKANPWKKIEDLEAALEAMRRDRINLVDAHMREVRQMTNDVEKWMSHALACSKIMAMAVDEIRDPNRYTFKGR